MRRVHNTLAGTGTRAGTPALVVNGAIVNGNTHGTSGDDFRGGYNARNTPLNNSTCIGAVGGLNNSMRGPFALFPRARSVCAHHHRRLSSVITRHGTMGRS